MNINGIRTHIIIGGMEILRCPRLAIRSSRRAPMWSFEITLPDPMGDVRRAVQLGDTANMAIGYRDKTPILWVGAVKAMRPGNKDQIIISGVGKDDELLNTVHVCQSWKNETPEAIIRYAASLTGLPTAQIDSPGVMFPRFVSSTVPVWQLARQAAETCQHSFDLNMSKWKLWLGPDGIHWGDHDQPSIVYPGIMTGEGLIKHLPTSNTAALSQVETFLLPAMRHSRIFALVDNKRGINDKFRALEVLHLIENTSARTHISYGVEYGY
ncbi:hypothetical protein [Desulfovibrio sp. UCD-KL4C]|uniref:hypothetical protein n=1 Tax=Desulfovibrio sp. UCD-KL4C TaxID=2578120 RepID=UPI0025BC3FBD|nr:hypothetical protein [Desulfovibrio sp. UCD-KL4C]